MGETGYRNKAWVGYLAPSIWKRIKEVGQPQDLFFLADRNNSKLLHSLTKHFREIS